MALSSHPHMIVFTTPTKHNDFITKQKFYKDICLLEQPFIKDTDKTVQDILNEQIAKIGEKISIRRFTRYERGEGLEKRDDNFAEEVAKQMCQ